MFCTNCGNKIPDGARFCDQCGQPTGIKPAPQPAPAPQPVISQDFAPAPAPKPVIPQEPVSQPVVHQEPKPEVHQEPKPVIPQEPAPRPVEPTVQIPKPQYQQPKPQYQAPQYQQPQYQYQPPQYQPPQYQPPQYQPPQPVQKKKTKTGVTILLVALLVLALAAAGFLGFRIVFGGAAKTSLDEIHELESWTYYDISSFENRTEYLQSVWGDDPDVLEEVWNEIKDVPVRATKKDLVEKNGDDYGVSLFFSEEEDFMVVDVYENGDMRVQINDDVTFYTGGEEIFTYLDSFLVDEIDIGEVMMDSEWEACSLYVYDANNNVVMEAWISDPAQVANAVESLTSITAEGSYYVFGEAESTVDIFLHGADGETICYCWVNSDGYGAIEGEEWYYGVRSNALYNKMFDLVVFNRVD